MTQTRALLAEGKPLREAIREASIGRHLWVVAHPPAAHARHGNRAPAGDRHDRRLGDFDGFHSACIANDPSVVCEAYRRKTRKHCQFILFFWWLPVGMFKTEVEENAFFSTARSYSNGHGNAGNNLKSVFEAVGPADSRAEQKVALPLYTLRSGHLLTAVESCLE